MAKTQLDRIEQKVDSLLKWVYGNGRDGAQVRIDRLEHNWRLAKWVIGIVAGLAVAVTSVAVKAWIGTP